MNTTNNTTIRNAWINWVNTGLVRTFYSKKNEKVFKDISIPYANSQNGFMKIVASDDAIYVSRYRTGKKNENYIDVSLGNPNAMRSVSICTKAPVKGVCQGEYKYIYMKNSEIMEIYNASREAYKTAKAFAQKTAA